MTAALTIAISLTTVAVPQTSCEVSPDTGPAYDECSPGWMRIPAGPFEMGLNADDPTDGIYCDPVDRYDPRYTVTLSEFCIQQTEVTVAAYRACVESGTCAPPMLDTENAICNYSAAPGGREKHPVNCVSWADARTYCQHWEGGDLPSEAQWEKAARGTDLRVFPWGNEPMTCERANYDVNGQYDEESGEGLGFGCDSKIQYTWEAGHIQGTQGDSPYGLKDMVGNVAEWTLDCLDRAFYLACSDGSCVDPVNPCDREYKIARGSAGTGWVEVPYGFGGFCLIARGDVSTSPNPGVGFRCVRSPDASAIP